MKLEMDDPIMVGLTVVVPSSSSPVSPIGNVKRTFGDGGSTPSTREIWTNDSVENLKCCRFDFDKGRSDAVRLFDRTTRYHPFIGECIVQRGKLSASKIVSIISVSEIDRV
jgi:hypothetical protein